MTTSSAYHGTVRYLAFEMVKDGELPSTASDIYALGCVGFGVRVYRISFITKYCSRSAFTRKFPMRTFKAIYRRRISGFTGRLSERSYRLQDQMISMTV
jgi:serine/threonine protein kinase